MNTRKIYLAYGSNLNKEQMSHRCPEAIAIGATELKDYRLAFRGSPLSAVATVEPCNGSSVPVALWSISAADERALDLYEGFPRLYVKVPLQVEIKGEKVTAMAYVMTPGHALGRPSWCYLNIILQGYRDFRISDTDELMSAATRI